MEDFHKALDTQKKQADIQILDIHHILLIRVLRLNFWAIMSISKRRIEILTAASMKKNPDKTRKILPKAQLMSNLHVYLSADAEQFWISPQEFSFHREFCHICN